jgi:hypothetical protein
MTESLALEWVVSVRGRFAWSVSLALDAGRADALAGYILMPAGRGELDRSVVWDYITRRKQVLS